MKTKIFLLMLIAVALFSCQKEKTDPATEQDVSFTAIQLTPDVGLKSTADVIPCKSDIPDYAAVKINGIWYYPALFTLDGQLYTQAIKFPVGAYTVTEFFLYKNVGGTTGYDDGDIIVFATPQAGVDYDQFITHHLPFTFTVEAFKKAQIEIEVLCFQDHLYTSFGFFWFHITEIIVREMCFFGDICLNGNGGVYPAWIPSDYDGSLYAANGTQEDEVAIFQVKVFKNGTLLPPPYDVFSNESWYGIGAPLCVVYPDNLSVVEVFTFEIWVYVKTLSGFGYQLYNTFTVTDGQVWVTGPDGIVDFAIGTCSPDSQYIWPWLTPLP